MHVYSWRLLLEQERKPLLTSMNDMWLDWNNSRHDDIAKERNEGELLNAVTREMKWNWAAIWARSLLFTPQVPREKEQSANKQYSNKESLVHLWHLLISIQKCEWNVGPKKNKTTKRLLLLVVDYLDYYDSLAFRPKIWRSPCSLPLLLVPFLFYYR